MYRAHLDTMTVRVWSPFLQRDVLITPRQFGLLCRLAQSSRSWRQRELAELAGYQTAGGVSRTLHQLARLGVIALSTTRGRNGSTVAWIRRGVNALRRNVAQHHWTEKLRGEPDRRVGQHSPAQLSELLPAAWRNTP